MFDINLFSFNGTPVKLKPLFLLTFLLMKPILVLCLFICVLIHELAHTWVAQKLNHHVSNIYIDFLSGGANMDLSKINPSDTIKIVFAGPLSNLILAGLTSILLLTGFHNEFILYTISFNLILGVFNLIPIYPMDGGRILEAFCLIKTNNDEFLSSKITHLISSICSLLLIFISVIYSLWITLTLSIIFIIINIILLFEPRKS